MKRVQLLFIVILCCSIAHFGRAQSIDPYQPDFQKPPKIKGYQLQWHDEFNNTGKPDPKKWVYEHGFVRNKELQWYQPENAYCKNGVLIIEGRREKVENPGYQKDSKDWRRNRKFAHYTSSAIETKGKQQFRFGKIIVRAKIDTSLGAWPAIWTLGIKGHWPQNGEVDIMEFYRWHHKPIILANACWGKGTWNTSRHAFADFIARDPDWPEKFHIWKMDWNKHFIKIYLDNQLMNTIDLSKTINPDGSNPFLKPQYLLLNLAIGATGGDPSYSDFPLKYEVDYVRYYNKH